VHISNPLIWIACGLTSVLFGSVWQMVVAISYELKSMESFLAAKNQLFLEERTRIRSSIPRHRMLKRRKAVKALIPEMDGVLSVDELSRQTNYLNQVVGWSAIVVGTLMGTIATWAQVFV
jgi:hypothetical protein